MSIDVLVVGDLVTDVLAIPAGPLAEGSDTAAEISMRGGGSGANTASWLAALGVPTGFAGVAGSGGTGAERVAELAAVGVRPFVRITADAPTGTVVVLSAEADRTMLCDRGANDLLSPADIDAGLAARPRHLHLSGYALLGAGSRAAGRYALRAAAAAGMTTSVDASSAAPLRTGGAAAFLSWVHGTDLLLATADEARVLVGDGEPADLARRLAQRVRQAVVKSGADGSVWAAAGTPPVAVPAEPAEVVDPTGAGDAYAAGLLAAWLSGSTPEVFLRSGGRAGARAVATRGGRP